MRNKAAFAKADCELYQAAWLAYAGIAWTAGAWEDHRHTLDFPEPESPIVTILLMKLYGWVG